MIALLLVAYAAEPATPGAIADALAEELHRDVTHLSFDDAPPIYFARYRALLLDQVDVEASLGALVSTSRSPLRQLGVELRVGTPDFDNSGFGGWQNGFRTSPLPAVVTPHAARSVAWRATDQAYKEAVEQYARKVAQIERPDDAPADYTLVNAVADDLSDQLADHGDASRVADGETLEALAREVSGALAADAGEHVLTRGTVAIGQESGADIIVDSATTRLITPREETTVRAAVHVQASDGMVLTDQRLWTVRRPEDLPTAAEMVASAHNMATALVTLADAEALNDEYVGPVLFEQGAAVDLFRYLLVPQLEGTPPDIPFNSFFGDLGGRGSGAVRLSRRVLPEGWSVDDDPTRNPSAAGAYAYDAEGTPAEIVPLISEGIVRTVLMSRTPRADVDHTNGHARGGFGERARGRAVDLQVTPAAHASSKAVMKRALKLAQSYGRDWVLVVRTLQEPSVMGLDDYSRFPTLDPEHPSLPAPVGAVRHYRDGHEESVRGLAFTGVQRYVLRDIAATGPQVTGQYLADSGGAVASYGLTSGMPTTLSAPEVLIGELELVPVNADPHAIPVIPAPPLSAAP